MILLIDNYDSFTYNIYQLLRKAGKEVRVFRNDEITIQEIQEMNPEAIVLSPGPKTPKDAGICLEIIKTLSHEIPILGICLGHQAICEAFGGKIEEVTRVLHGKSSPIFHTRKDVFKSVSLPTKGARYHSLIAQKSTLPSCLEIVAEDEEGTIMAVKHKTRSCFGIQFHPESILTSEGETLIKNFLAFARGELC